MQNQNTLESTPSHKNPARDLRALPLEEHFLPVQSPPLLTGDLWRRVFDAAGIESAQERADALSFYGMFALLGLIGSNREHRQDLDTLLMPVVFEQDKFSVRLTIHRRVDAPPVLTFSLPEESVPVLA